MGSVRSISLVRRLPPLLRLNVLPFVIAYAVLTALYLQSPPVPLDSVTSISNSSATSSSPLASPLIELNNDSSPSSSSSASSSSSIERDLQPSETREETEEEAAARATEEWMAEVEDWARRMSGENWAIAGALVALLHVLSLLVPHWSNAMDFFLTCYTVGDVSRATLAKVVPKSSVKGSVELCPVQSREKAGGGKEWWFVYQERKFTYHEADKQFHKLDFPVAEPFAFYQKAKGHSTESFAAAQDKWGINRFEIPLPQFWDLYREQALAPFFVFQVFCVLLWCLDDYWQYSLLTLVLLLAFESTVVTTRMQNLKALREMSEAGKPKHMVHVYRGGRWSVIKCEELLPGDITSVSRSKEPIIAPCDMVLLSGSCVVDEAMLTGESTPQLKESVEEQEPDHALEIRKNHIHVIFGGTTVVQTSPPNRDTARLRAPDGGCLAYVLRTGFETSQGKLMRTILFSSERVTANSKETFFFIACLLTFAISASTYVFNKGMEEGRSKYKLLLECALIITSVVPPELPTELSLAVNTSLQALRKLGVFCTEPFRIPFAGKVDVCCFDKTGTLTNDQLTMEGVLGLPGTGNELTPGKEIKDEHLLFTIAGCHSLVYLDGQQVGDPMELAALEGINWAYSKGEVAVPRKGSSQRNVRVRVVRRFHFTSELKRMSAIVALDHETPAPLLAVAKGAPEVMKQFFKDVPAEYDELHQVYARRGFRIIAAGYKALPALNSHEVTKLVREDIESELVFGGFVVFSSVLKPESLVVVKRLIESSHKVVMITGDNTLTACQVAKDLTMTSRPVLILAPPAVGERNAEWRSIDESVTKKLALGRGKFAGVEGFDLCVSGDGLTHLQNAFGDDRTRSALAAVTVWARVSPQQKEYVLAGLKASGHTTLMCGDGTNDVGALKQAHVGIALLTSTNKAKEPAAATKPAAAAAPVAAEKPRPTGTSSGATAGAARRGAQGAKDRRGPGAAITLQALLEEEEAGMVQLGDASIASPFTARSTTIGPVEQILQQGRCTLATTMQMYKILALNCLISAYSLSVLYYDGIKLGDTQMTCVGVLVAMCFLFITRSKPLEKLSAQRPAGSIFAPGVVVSLLGQFAVHYYALTQVLALAHAAQGPENRASLDAQFTPNMVNSAVFLITSAMQVATFTINHRGRPFKEDLWENKGLLYGLSAMATLTLVAALECLPPFNTYLQLVPLPFKWAMVGYVVGDFVVAFAWDRLCLLVFRRA